MAARDITVDKTELALAAMPKVRALGLGLTVVNYSVIIRWILMCARRSKGGTLFAANAHMTVLAIEDKEFRKTVNSATVVVPDGQPVRWSLVRIGIRLKNRVYGPELAVRLCAALAVEGIPVGFFGGVPGQENADTQLLRSRFPGLSITYWHAPPFYDYSAAANAKELERIRDAGVRVLFVGLGCPKQEKWVMANSGDLCNVVILGVGAFFGFVSGRVRQAPPFMQRHGLEWMFRLGVEPRRLFKRYLITNVKYIYYFTRSVMFGLGLGMGLKGIDVHREKWKIRGIKAMRSHS